MPTGDAAKKLTESKVRKMRQYYKDGHSTRDIAAWFDVSANRAWQVVTYRAWRHVK